MLIGSSFKLLLPRRVTFAFLSCSMPGDEAEIPFAGFSIHCSDQRLFKRVLADVQVTADKGWGILKVFSDFIYLSPQVPRDLNAINCWLKRQTFYSDGDGHRRDFTVCIHNDEVTAVEGLSETMLPKTGRPNCWHYLPPPGPAGEAAAGDIAPATQGPADAAPDTQNDPAPTAPDTQVTAEQANVMGVVTVVPSPDLHAGVVPTPTLDQYRELYPVVYLTPLLIGRRSPLLRERGQAYHVGKSLGMSDRCEWFEGRTCNFAVVIKLLPPSARKECKVRTIREVFALEQCRDRCRHVIRILDMFLDSVDLLHLVFESWGLPLHHFRAQRGYGREDAQPCHHVRRVIFHIGEALHYLHWSLDLVHACVSLECILVAEDPGSLSRGIFCRLGGFTSLEEASFCCSSSWGISCGDVAGPWPNVFQSGRPGCRQYVPAWPSRLTV